MTGLIVKIMFMILEYACLDVRKNRLTYLITLYVLYPMRTLTVKMAGFDSPLRVRLTQVGVPTH